VSLFRYHVPLEKAAERNFFRTGPSAVSVLLVIYELGFLFFQHRKFGATQPDLRPVTFRFILVVRPANGDSGGIGTSSAPGGEFPQPIVHFGLFQLAIAPTSPASL